LATSYPTAIDTFVDPSATDTMDGGVGGPTVYHDLQHTNLNDAVTALEVFVGTSGSPNFIGTISSFEAVTISGNSYTIDYTSSADILILTMTQDTQFSFENFVEGAGMIVILLGAFNPTWNGSIDWQPFVPGYVTGMVIQFLQGPSQLIGLAAAGIPTNTYAVYGSGLLLSGGTMTGSIAMGSHSITGLLNGVNPQDAAAFVQIPVPANGYGITGNTGSTPTPAVSLSDNAGSISSDVTFATGNYTEVFATGSLAVGTWLVFGSVLCAFGTAAATIEIQLVVNTATATITGLTSGEAVLNSTVLEDCVPFAALVVVTGAGSLKVWGYNNSGSNTATASAKTRHAADMANATGWAAMRIA